MTKIGIISKAFLMISLATSWQKLCLSDSTHPHYGGVDREGSASIDVRISPSKNKIRAGETLQMRVEIWNTGNKDIFVCRDFLERGLVYCNLSIWVEDSKGPHEPQTGLAADTFPTKKESFVNALSSNWIALSPGHFYGTLTALSPSSYEVLEKPGIYRIRGEYSSGGLLAPTYYNSLRDYANEIDGLPAKDWVGRVDTNSVSIQVLPHAHVTN